MGGFPDDDGQEGGIQALEEARIIAAQITSKAQEEWLAEAIAATAMPTLRAELGAARFSVDRRRVAKMIATGQMAYAQLMDVLCDIHVMLQIGRDWPDDVPWSGYHQLKKALVDYGPALDRTFARTCDRFGGKRGPGRVGLDFHDQSAEWCCAAYAVILCRAVRSEQVRPGSQGLHRLCAALWRAAGGSDDPDWRHHIDSVLAFLRKSPEGDRDRTLWWFQNAEQSFNELATWFRMRHDKTC